MGEVGGLSDEGVEDSTDVDNVEEGGSIEGVGGVGVVEYDIGNRRHECRWGLEKGIEVVGRVVEWRLWKAVVRALSVICVCLNISGLVAEHLQGWSWVPKLLRFVGILST